MKSVSARLPPKFLQCALVVAFVYSMFGDIASARTINWSGYDWWVRSSNGNPQGPGPNIFSDSAQNVFVDAQGNLHLKIRQGADGKWTSSEVDLNQSLSYGTYEWELSSRYDQFAPNVVGGLFTYLSPEAVAAQTGGVVGNGVADTPHEIDIEFTGAWGSANLFYTTHDGDVPAPSVNYKQTLGGDYTTHRFTWAPGRIEWESFNGHVAGVADPPFPIVEQRPGAQNGQPAHRVYTGAVVPQDLTEIPIINFWLFGDNPSVDGPVGGAGGFGGPFHGVVEGGDFDEDESAELFFGVGDGAVLDLALAPVLAYGGGGGGDLESGADAGDEYFFFGQEVDVGAPGGPVGGGVGGFALGEAGFGFVEEESEGHGFVGLWSCVAYLCWVMGRTGRTSTRPPSAMAGLFLATARASSRLLAVMMTNPLSWTRFSSILVVPLLSTEMPSWGAVRAEPPVIFPDCWMPPM